MPRAVVRGIELAWSERGEGAGILFLHGFPFSRRMWDAQLAALPPGWRGIAPDLRGFGESGGSDQPAYTMEDHAADMIALLDRVALERVVVCGLSMGGYIALALHRAVSHRVRALVLADTRAEPDSPEGREQRLAQAEAIRRDGPDAFIDAQLPKLLSDPDHTAALGRVREMMQRTTPDTLVRALQGLAIRPDARPGLPDIRVPTLVVGGQADAITPPDTLAALARAIPDARLELLPGAGHVAPVEAEDAFNRALNSFLESLPD